jgi:hypothetical protein
MAKGSDYEREIAKRISIWFSEGERDDVFWRTSQSGGRATERYKRGSSTQNSDGDLSFIDESGACFIRYYLVEIKRGYNAQLDILNWIDGKSNPILFDWFTKSKREKRRANRKQVLIIFRRDKKRSVVAIDGDHFRELQHHFGLLSGSVIKLERNASNIRKQIALIPFDSFFNWYDPAIIKDGIL